MEFKSRIFATSRGSTIDAIGDGKYLVCNPAYCFMVHGPVSYTHLRAHET